MKIDYLKCVKFNANGGIVSAYDRYLTKNEAVGSLPSPTRTGHTFDGWYTAASGGTKISAATKVSSDVTYYAHWTVNRYTVFFHANGGNGGRKVSLAYGTALGTLPTPWNNDCDFIGWFTESVGGTRISSATTVSGDVTYYAHWQDVIPALADGATAADVAEALSGSADERLTERITTAKDYGAYRQWVVRRKLSHKAVHSSANAWLAYVLDSTELLNRTEAVAKDDLQISAFKPSDSVSGAFGLDFGIADITVGNGAEPANLAAAFAVEGAAELTDAFSSDGLSVDYSRTADGKVRATVVPARDSDGNLPPSFFLRVKVR